MAVPFGMASSQMTPETGGMVDRSNLLELVGEETDNGAFGNVLRFLSRPGFAVRSVLLGDLEGAARNVAQLANDLPFGGFIDRRLSATNVLNALLPESMELPTELAGKKFQPEASDVLSRWGLLHKDSLGFFEKLGVDIVGGTLTDPLTLLTGGGGAGRGIAKGLLVGAKRADAADTVLTALRTTPKGLDALTAARNEVVEGLETVTRKVSPDLLKDPEKLTDLAAKALAKDPQALDTLRQQGLTAGRAAVLARGLDRRAAERVFWNAAGQGDGALAEVAANSINQFDESLALADDIDRGLVALEQQGLIPTKGGLYWKIPFSGMEPRLLTGNFFSKVGMYGTAPGWARQAMNLTDPTRRLGQVIDEAAAEGMNWLRAKFYDKTEKGRDIAGGMKAEARSIANEQAGMAREFLRKSVETFSWTDKEVLARYGVVNKDAKKIFDDWGRIYDNVQEQFADYTFRRTEDVRNLVTDPAVMRKVEDYWQVLDQRNRYREMAQSTNPAELQDLARALGTTLPNNPTMHGRVLRDAIRAFEAGPFAKAQREADKAVTPYFRKALEDQVVAAITQGEEAFADALVQVSQKRAALRAAQEGLANNYLDDARSRAEDLRNAWAAGQPADIDALNVLEAILRGVDQGTGIEGARQSAESLKRSYGAVVQGHRRTARNMFQGIQELQSAPLGSVGVNARVMDRLGLEGPYAEIVQEVLEELPVPLQGLPQAPGAPHALSAQRHALERQQVVNYLTQLAADQAQAAQNFDNLVRLVDQELARISTVSLRESLAQSALRGAEAELETAVRALDAQYEPIRKHVSEGVQFYFDEIARMPRELKREGVWRWARENPFYLPRQVSAAFHEIAEQAMTDKRNFQAFRDIFTRARKYQTKEEWIAALNEYAEKLGLDPADLDLQNTNFLQLFQRRVFAHHKTLARTRLMNHARRVNLAPRATRADAEGGEALALGAFKATAGNPVYDDYVRYQLEGLPERGVTRLLGGGTLRIPIKNLPEIERVAKKKGWKIKDGHAEVEIAGINAYYKPLLTSFPTNLSFHVRNAFSAAYMSLFDPDINSIQAARQIWGAFRNGPLVRVLGKMELGGDEITDVVRYLSDDPTTSKQALESLTQRGTRIGPYTWPEVAKVLDQALGRGIRRPTEKAFEATATNQADLLSRLAEFDHLGREVFNKKPGVLATARRWFRKGVSIGSDWADSIEKRFRAQATLSLLAKGVPPDQALKRVGDAFVDYSLNSEVERFLRDVIPFAKFSLHSLKWAKNIAHEPRLVNWMGRARSSQDQEGQILPERAEDSLALPLPWRDAEGNVQFLLGLGLPVETTLNILGAATPQGLRRQVLGGIQPLVRFPIEGVVGKSFYFGEEWGSYRKAPEFLAASGLATKIELPDGSVRYEVPGEVNEIWNAMPTSRQDSILNKIISWRRKSWHEALVDVANLGTGLRTMSADTERELQKRLGDYLKAKAGTGQIGETLIYFARFDKEGMPEDLKIALKAMQEIRNDRKKAQEQRGLARPTLGF